MSGKDAMKQAICQAIKDQSEEPPRLGEMEVIGTCSKCRGPVVIPKLFYSVVDPTPTCQKCGAKKKERFGPIIEME